MGKNNKAACTENGVEALGPLSASDLRTYNRLADQMDGFVSIEYLARATRGKSQK